MKIGLVKKSGKSMFIVFLLTFFVLCAALVAVLNSFKPVFEEKALHLAKKEAINIINNGTSKAFSCAESYEMVNITTDAEGKITSITANSIALNWLKAEISTIFEDTTEKEQDFFVYIPVGSLTPFPVLQGVGYRIPVRVHIDGFSKIDFGDEFISCGINQTKHKIFMTASVNISVISAAMVKTTTIETEILVSETVIVGEVPEVYGSNLGVIGR